MPPSRILLLLALSIPFATLAQQSSAPLPVYDVVSIHENRSGSNTMSIRGGGAGFVATNVDLTTLLMNAYNIRRDLMSGLPGWANSTSFDVNAKVSDPDIAAMKDLPRGQRQAMLVTLLQDRFHLRAHIEVKTLPVYDLVIAKGGSKLKENAALPTESSDPNNGPSKPKPGSMMVSNSQMTAVGIATSNLAANLAFHVERNVIDKTGLTGKYDFTLKWRPDNADATTDNNAPDLFTALQEQLGLKLEPSKGPVDTLVIDHIERPSEN